MVVAGEDLYDDLLNTSEAGAISPFGTGGACRNCFVGGSSCGAVIGGSAALLDKILEKDIGLEAFVSSCSLG